MVVIKDASAAALKTMLRFVYTGRFYKGEGTQSASKLLAPGQFSLFHKDKT